MHNIELFVWCVTQIDKQHDSINLLSSVDATMRSNGATATADFRQCQCNCRTGTDDVNVLFILLTCHAQKKNFKKKLKNEKQIYYFLVHLK